MIHDRDTYEFHPAPRNGDRGAEILFVGIVGLGLAALLMVAAMRYSADRAKLRQMREPAADKIGDKWVPREGGAR